MTKRKVKFFLATDTERLERNINRFLDEYADRRLINVSFSKDTRAIFLYTAAVIYEEEKDG